MTASCSQRRSYYFTFLNEEDAAGFLDFAKTHERVLLAQHPYDGSGKPIRNPLHVLVTIKGWGYDPFVHSKLVDEAEKLGGHYIRRVEP